jgi:hypothetical protein
MQEGMRKKATRNTDILQSAMKEGKLEAFAGKIRLVLLDLAQLQRNIWTIPGDLSPLPDLHHSNALTNAYAYLSVVVNGCEQDSMDKPLALKATHEGIEMALEALKGLSEVDVIRTTLIDELQSVRRFAGQAVKRNPFPNAPWEVPAGEVLVAVKADDGEFWIFVDHAVRQVARWIEDSKEEAEMLVANAIEMRTLPIARRDGDAYVPASKLHEIFDPSAKGA